MASPGCGAAWPPDSSGSFSSWSDSALPSPYTESVAPKPDNATKPDSPPPPAPPEQPPEVEPYLGVFHLEGNVLRKLDPPRYV